MAGGEGEEVGQAVLEPGGWPGHGLAPGPSHLSQSWQQVLSWIKKASFGVCLPRPDPELSRTGSLSAGGSDFFPQFLQEGKERDKWCLSKSFAAWKTTFLFPPACLNKEASLQIEPAPAKQAGAATGGGHC